MTDQRDRVSTDPGIGPIDVNDCSTLRSIAAAEEIEPDGASLYYEPKPLISISDHKTLEVATVRLSEDIDPRRLRTELSLSRSPAPPRYESGWPQAEVVLTRSERPTPPKHRWRVPALMFAVLGALLALMVARRVLHQVPVERELMNPKLSAHAAGPKPGSAPDLAAAAAATPQQASGTAAASSAATVPGVASAAATAPVAAVASAAAIASALDSAPSVNVAPVAAEERVLGIAGPSSSAQSSSPTPSGTSAVIVHEEPSTRRASAAHPSFGTPNLQSSGGDPLSAPPVATAKRAIY